LSVAAPAGRFRFAPILTATVLTVLLLWLFGKAAHVFLLLFLAVIVALYLGAVADFLAARLRLPARVAFIAAVLFTLGAIVGLFWLLVPPVIDQTQQLVRVLPRYIAGWEEGIGRFVAHVPGLQQFWHPEEHKVLVAVYDQLAGQFETLVPKVFSLFHAAINVFSVAVMSVYLALYPGLYREWLIALFPPVHRDLVRDVLHDAAETLRSWIVAQLLAMFILAVLTAIGLYLLGVPYALTFGVFTGAVAIVPFFGTLLSTTLPALFVLGGPGGGGRALAVVALGIVIHVLEGNLVMPLITARQVELPPVLTIMSVLVVGSLLGPPGLLIAVPLLAVTMVFVRRILVNRVYQGQGFRRSARDRTLVLRVPAPGVLVADAPPIDIIALAEQDRARRTA
jgi:predicted PurR-regulated permease PerM